jgi:hypothetical protein
VPVEAPGAPDVPPVATGVEPDAVGGIPAG